MAERLDLHRANPSNKRLRMELARLADICQMQQSAIEGLRREIEYLRERTMAGY